MEKIKISNHQLMAIVAAFVCGSSTLAVSAGVVGTAGQDAWLTVIFATLTGLPVIWMHLTLGARYPDKTFLELFPLLLGKWAGGLVSILYIFVALVSAVQVVWYVGDFFATQYMSGTPFMAINLMFILVVVIAMLYGLESIARASEIFFYVIFGVFFLSAFMTFPKAHPENLFPVLEKGAVPVLKAALPLLSYTVFPMVLLNMVYPVNLNLSEPKKTNQAFYRGYFLGMSIVLVAIGMCVMVLGNTITANSRFPVFLLTKEIDVGVFVSRMEALIVIVWLITIFNRTLFYFYMGTIGLAKLLKLDDYRRIVLPLGLLMTIYSDFIYKNVSYEIRWDSQVWVPHILVFGLILPVMLFIVALFRKKQAKR